MSLQFNKNLKRIEILAIAQQIKILISYLVIQYFMETHSSFS